MNELIAKIKAKLSELRQQANAQLAKMLPLEQQEGAEQVGYIFRTARNIVEYLTEITGSLESKVGELAEEFKTTARAELKADEVFRQEVAKDPKVLEVVKAQLIQSGDLLTKVDHAAKLEQAEKAAATAAKTGFDQEIADKTKIEKRRGEAATEIAGKLGVLKEGAKAVATEVASKLTDDVLKGDGYRTAITDAANRIEKCVALNIVKGETLQEVASLGEDEFKRLHSGWDQQHKASGGRATAPLATPATLPGTGGDGGEKGIMF